MARDFKVLMKVITETRDAINDLNKVNKTLGLSKGQWLAVGASAAAAGTAIVASAVKAIKAASEQEKQERMLAAAMEQAGTFTQEAFQHNLDYASSLQKMTTFGDEAILTVQKMLTNFGIEGDMLDQLTNATLDLATAKGMDLTAASDLVAKSVGSSTNALSRYGITIEGTVGSTERAQNAVNEIARLFGGSAVASANTFSGQLTQLNNIIGDIFEDIGFALIPTLNEFVKTAKNDIAPAIKDATEKLAEYGDTITNAIKTTFYFTKMSFNLSRVLRGRIISGIKGTIEAYKEWQEASSENTKEVVNNVNIVNTAWEDMLIQQETISEKMNLLADENSMLEQERTLLLFDYKKSAWNNYVDFVNNQKNVELLASQKILTKQIETLHKNMQAAIQSSFATSIKNMIDNGWKFNDVMTNIGTAIRDVYINMIAKVAAEWVAKTAIMQAATLAWKGIVVLANAAATAASAALSAIRSIPFPFNIPAAAAAAAGAYALVTKYLASGVRGFQGGPAIVNEKGTEMILPPGTNVMNNAETRNVLARKPNNIGTGKTYNINIFNNSFMGSPEENAEALGQALYSELQLQGNV